MSILHYYKVIRKVRNNDEGLPDPRGPLSDKISTDTIKSANAAVTKAITKSETSQNKKGAYLYLKDAQRYEVRKKAAAVGTTDVLRYFAHRYPGPQ